MSDSSSDLKPEEPNRCIAVDCAKPIKKPMLMCRRHWGMATYSLRARVSALFKANDFGAEWEQATGDLVRRVNAFENNLKSRRK